MALINLLTDPKNFIFYTGKGYQGDGSKTGMTDIPYGKDQPGGGSSNQPYIQTDIPNQSSPLNGGADSDFLLRGGITAPLDAAQDVLRLSKFFIDTKSPNGLFFTLKQNLLSRTSVRTQASTGPSYGGAAGGVNQGIYTPLSTLAQAGVGFTGTHLNLFGLDPSSPMTGVLNGGLFPNLGLNRYSDTVKSTQDSLDNRLVLLTNSKIVSFDSRLADSQSTLPKYSISPNLTDVLSYGGGPGSILGIGKTNIPFADQRTGLNNPNINPPKKTVFATENYDGSPIILGLFSSDFYKSPARISGINYDTALLFSGVSNNIQIDSPNYDRFDNISLINNQGTGGEGLLSSLNNPLINPPGRNPRKQLFVVTDYDGSPKILGNFQFSDYYKTPARVKINYNNVLGASKKYQSYTDSGFNSLESNYIENGDLLTNPNIYKSDSLIPFNSNKFGTLSWTPSFQNPVGPNSSTTYLQDLVETGSLSTIKFDTDITDGGVLPLNSVYKSGSLDFNDKILENNTKVLTQEQISQIGSELNNKNKIGSPSIIDFRKRLLNNEDFQAPDYSGPDSKNIENRVFLGDPGIKGYVGSYETGKDGLDGNPLGPLDKINASKLNKDKTKVIYDSNGAEKEGKSNDLVKFRIASIDSGGGSEQIYMHFRAFLDSFQDSYNASWTDHQYLGRGEKFYTYNGFTRAISLSWTVVAQSKEELIPMYRKLNYLASNLAPDYSTNGYMRGPLVSLTLGGYLYEQPGFITALTYDIPNDSTWEIGINNEGGDDNNVKELSHMIKVTGFNFTPIQKFTPRKGNPNSLGAIPFIALTAGGNSNY